MQEQSWTPAEAEHEVKRLAFQAWLHLNSAESNLRELEDFAKGNGISFDDLFGQDNNPLASFNRFASLIDNQLEKLSKLS